MIINNKFCIFVIMVIANLLIETDNGQDFRKFYFNINSVNGIYIIDSELMGVVIGSNEYIMQFDNTIFEKSKQVLELKTLGLN
jgi:hypothetical protein